MTDVRSLVFPRSIALVGASPRRPAPVENARSGGAVPVWGVHPAYPSVLGLPCVPSLDRLTEVPETAVMLVGHERIEAAVAEAIDAGVRSFVIHGLGSEAGAAGPAVAARVIPRIRASGGMLIGPNCMGVAVPGGASTWLSALPETYRPGQVAAVVQSGSIGESLLALGPRVGFRAVVSCGAEALSSAADYVAFFADDPGTRAIALFVEAVRDPDAFSRSLERCAAKGKPVVCLKVGRSAVAERTALAHTGAIVGSELAFSALLRRHGAIEVPDFPELVETIEILGRRRWPRGVRVAVVSESGGEAALLADASARHGLEFPPLPAEVSDTLSERFPALLHPTNPLDAWAVDAPERIYPQSLGLLARCAQFDALIALVDLSRFRPPADQVWNEVIVQGLADAIADTAVFGAVATTHTTDPPDWAYALASALDLPLLRGLAHAARALAQVARWRPRRVAEPVWDEAIELADLLTRPGPLPEHESSAILERYGVRFAARRRAAGAAEASRAAAELGPPVVVKVDGPAHKARDGGVVTNVTTPAAAGEAATRLGGRVLVAKQIAGATEVFCGMTRDPQYGPVLVVGCGGGAVEAHRYRAAIVGPVGLEDAGALVAEAGLADPDASIAGVLVALGRLAAEHPEVAEIDVNPLIVTAADSIAVDALVVLGAHAAPGRVEEGSHTA